MRTALLVLSVGALIGATSACTSSSMGGDDLSAEAREQEVIDTVTQVVPVAQDALGATKVVVDGTWRSCPGGIGHRFTGGGTLSAPQGNSEAQLAAIRTAVVEAGFDDETQVDGYVSVSRGDVEIDFSPQLAARTPGTWQVSYQGPCKSYGGDDEDYVEAQNLEGARRVLP